MVLQAGEQGKENGSLRTSFTDVGGPRLICVNTDSGQVSDVCMLVIVPQLFLPGVPVGSRESVVNVEEFYKPVSTEALLRASRSKQVFTVVLRHRLPCSFSPECITQHAGIFP